MTTSTKHSGFKRLIDQTNNFGATVSELGLYVNGQEAMAFRPDSVGTYALTMIGKQNAEALASIIDGYGVSLATGYDGTSDRIYAFEVNADTGSTDLTGDVNAGAIKGRTVIGTTQTNCGISGITGTLDIGTVNLISNYQGISGVLDFYGNCTITGSVSHLCALSGCVWNEATTTLNSAGGCVAGLDLIQNSGQPTLTAGVNPAINIRASASSRWQYGIYMADVERVLYAPAVLSGSTALHAAEIVVTDTTATSSGDLSALHLNTTISGDHTGTGWHGGLAIDYAITGNSGYAFPLWIYVGGCGDATIGNFSGFYIYMDDIGGSATVTNRYALDLNIDNGDNATPCGYIRCYNHGGASNTMDYVFDFANSGHGVADYFIHVGATGGLVEIADITSGKTCTHGLRCLIGASTVGVIPLYED